MKTEYALIYQVTLLVFINPLMMHSKVYSNGKLIKIKEAMKRAVLKIINSEITCFIASLIVSFVITFIIIELFKLR